eukprot:Gb_06554 [translate_table: standard]
MSRHSISLMLFCVFISSSVFASDGAAALPKALVAQACTNHLRTVPFHAGSTFFICGECLDGPAEPGCNNNTCQADTTNYATRILEAGVLSQDAVALFGSDGKSQGPKVRVPGFVFSCASASLLEGLAKGAAGVAGLSRSSFAMPTQLAAGFGFQGSKLSICLPGADNAEGALVIGEYYVGLKNIAVNGKKLRIDSARLEIDSDGNGGTMLSTMVPYTKAVTPIYRAIRNAFVREAKAMNITRVASVKPFDACFDAKTLRSTRLGPAVPTIDLELRSGPNTDIWKIVGANSMVQVNDGVSCLAFVDAGNIVISSIVIGRINCKTYFCSSIFTAPTFFSPPHCSAPTPLVPTLSISAPPPLNVHDDPLDVDTNHNDKGWIQNKRIIDQNYRWDPRCSAPS